MKKTVVFLLASLLAFCAPLSAMAASETFVDPVEDGFPKAHSHSPKMYYQKNEDMDCTILVKQDDNGSPSTKEHIVYKMKADITGFALDCMHVNGLGNGETDIKVYVSPDDKAWKEIPVKASEQTFNDEIYIDEEHAYWKQSTVSNKGAVPAGNRFIKIEIQPFTVKGSCTWNTVIDTVKITMNKKDNKPAPEPTKKPTTKPDKPDDNKKPVAPTTAADASNPTVDKNATTTGVPDTTTAADATAAEAADITTTAPSDSQANAQEKDEGMSTGAIVGWVILGVVVAGGIACGVVFWLKKRNK